MSYICYVIIVAFCKLNCAVRGDSGCDTCKDGYVDEPECCDCDTEGNSTHAYYRTDTGECKRKLHILIKKLV